MATNDGNPKGNSFWDSLTNRGNLVIGTSPTRILVVIDSNGTLTYGPDYTPDEAAQVFWSRLAKHRAESETQQARLSQMKDLLKKIGNADLSCEKFREEAAKEGLLHKRAAAEQMADLALRSLEGLVHQVIELGREVALEAKSVNTNPNLH